VDVPVTAAAAVTRLPARAAQMAAVEILLADPQSLGDDVLESSLYILREKLRGSGTGSAERTAHPETAESAELPAERATRTGARLETGGAIQGGAIQGKAAKQA
jgi:hypothetical protein